MPGKGLLIVGSIPPPTGGVTVHVSRLLAHLRQQDLPHDFADVRREKLPALAGKLWKAPVVHLQVSSSLFRFLAIVFLRPLGKKIVFTFHGNVGRYGAFKNFIDKLSFAMADVPVVLNSGSFESAHRWNKSTRIISAFIPPAAPEALAPPVERRIEHMKSNYSILYAANASYLQYDKQGREVYQLIPLVELFREPGDKGLVLSDPSGMYSAYFEKKGITLPPNILLIKGAHSFFALLKQVQVFLRITTTDGDALSVKEALYLNRVVIASDVVERPPGTRLTSLEPGAIRAAIETAAGTAAAETAAAETAAAGTAAASGKAGPGAEARQASRPRTPLENGAQGLVELYQSLRT